jgi:hypothetical protein
MNSELQKKLVEKHPQIFSMIGGNPMETCMAWGLECGDGWHDLIDTLCATMSNMVKNLKRRWSDKHPDLKFGVRAEQVKEKYGTLRFYIHFDLPDDFHDRAFDPALLNDLQHTIEAIHGAITMAEAMSSRICEDCGARGRIKPALWLHCECEECERKHNEKYDKIASETKENP